MIHLPKPDTCCEAFSKFKASCAKNGSRVAARDERLELAAFDGRDGVVGRVELREPLARTHREAVLQRRQAVALHVQAEQALHTHQPRHLSRDSIKTTRKRERERDDGTRTSRVPKEKKKKARTQRAGARIKRKTGDPFGPVGFRVFVGKGASLERVHVSSRESPLESACRASVRARASLSRVSRLSLSRETLRTCALEPVLAEVELFDVRRKAPHLAKSAETSKVHTKSTKGNGTFRERPKSALVRICVRASSQVGRTIALSLSPPPLPLSSGLATPRSTHEGPFER